MKIYKCPYCNYVWEPRKEIIKMCPSCGRRFDKVQPIIIETPTMLRIKKRIERLDERIAELEEKTKFYGQEMFERGKRVGAKEIIGEIERIKIVDYPNFIINLKDWEAIKKRYLK
jgi:tetrahydromethanopterin S-methyltransferase subunit G